MDSFRFCGQNQENGQALVGGISFILLVLLFCAYLLYVCESFGRKYYNQEKATEDAIYDAAKVANIINQVSMNNQSIIASIITSQNAFAKAFELGLYTSYNQPYWETYGSLNQKKNALEKSKDTLENAYRSYALTTARGFFIAKSLSEKNKKLVESLPKKISIYFTQSSNAQLHCFALEAQKNRYQSPGFINFQVPKFYRYFLSKNGCGVHHKVDKVHRVAQKSMPVLYSTELDDVLSYDKIDDFSLSKNLNPTHYGVWFVDPSYAPLFLDSLLFQTQNSVDVEKKYSIFEKFLSRIQFFSSIGLGNNKNLSAVLSKTKIRISHPDFICQKNKSRIGDFLTENDWKNIPYCNLSSENFLRSFFFPNWSPLVVEQESR